MATKDDEPDDFEDDAQSCDMTRLKKHLSGGRHALMALQKEKQGTSEAGAKQAAGSKADCDGPQNLGQDFDDATSTKTGGGKKDKLSEEDVFQCGICVGKKHPLSEQCPGRSWCKTMKYAMDGLAYCAKSQGKEAKDWWEKTRLQGGATLFKACKKFLEISPPMKTGPGRKRVGTPKFIIARYTEEMKTESGTKTKGIGKKMWDEQ